MNTPKMNLNPGNAGKKGSGKEPAPEEIQAQFFADLGNALINIANFTGHMKNSLSEMQKDIESMAANSHDMVEMRRTEMIKVHGIPPDDLPDIEPDPEEPPKDEGKPDGQK